jgi:hypothetical protein
VSEVRVEEVIKAFADTRYRHLIRSESRGRTAKFLNAVGRVWNEQAEPGRRLVAFEVQNRVWNFKNDPQDPEHGKLRSSFKYTLPAR